MTVRHTGRMGTMIFALAAQSCFAKDVPLLSLSLEHFRDTATIKDDPIAGETLVTTEKGYVERHGPLGTVWNDEYLSATIDRKIPRSTFEVIVTITYRGTRRFYGSAQFQTANGPRVEPAKPLSTTAVNCPTGECTYTDSVSFSVEEGMLRMLTAVPATDRQVWHFNVLAKPSGEYSGAFSSAEIAGFLAKVDEYSGAAPMPGSRPAPTAARELGIGGLRVDATEQQPARSGVLVTAVRPGSLGSKAGLIVGDIVHEIDGRAVQSPPDMQAALQASPSNASITIEIYRGLTKVTLTSAP